MKAGILGLVVGELDDIDSFHQTQKQDGTQFSRSLQVEQVGTTEAGSPIYEGEAAIEEVEEIESVTIEQETGEIVVTEQPLREGKYTQVLIVPNEFAVVSSSAGRFAFDLVQETQPGITVSRSSLDLNEYANKYYDAPDVDPWQVGFYGNIGEAEKGVVYGEDVYNDEEMSEILERSQINQLGLRYDVLGHDIKMTMAESGYVEVYQPSNFSTEDFATYLEEEMLPIASLT